MLPEAPADGAARGGSRLDKLLKPLGDLRERSIERMLGVYERWVRWCLRERYVVLAATTAVLMVSVGMVFGGRLLPRRLTACPVADDPRQVRVVCHTSGAGCV